jgi:hypothetical protein
MRMTKVEFRKKYQRPEKQVEGKMHEWYQNILHRNHAEIMLSEIPFRCVEYDTQSYAYVATGYKVKVVCRVGDPYVIAAYSPLVGGFIGHTELSYYDVTEGLYHTSAMFGAPLTPEPLDDETSKLILMADCIPSLCATLANDSPLYKWQFGSAAVGDDMLLNLVSCIRRQEKEKRDRLMCLFDTYGAPKGLLGEALMHIDKFRSI